MSNLLILNDFDDFWVPRSSQAAKLCRQGRHRHRACLDSGAPSDIKSVCCVTSPESFWKEWSFKIEHISTTISRHIKRHESQNVRRTWTYVMTSDDQSTEINGPWDPGWMVHVLGNPLAQMAILSSSRSDGTFPRFVFSCAWPGFFQEDLWP